MVDWLVLFGVAYVLTDVLWTVCGLDEE